MTPHPISVRGASYAQLATLDKLPLTHDLARRSRTAKLSSTGRWRAVEAGEARMRPESAAAFGSPAWSDEANPPLVTRQTHHEIWFGTALGPRGPELRLTRPSPAAEN